MSYIGFLGGVVRTITDQTIDGVKTFIKAPLFNTGVKNYTSNIGSVSGNVIVNLGIADFFYLTATGDVNLSFTGNPISGYTQSIVIRIKQDSTGSRNISLPIGTLFIEGVAPTFSTSANAVDLISFIYDPVSGNYIASVAKGIA